MRVMIAGRNNVFVRGLVEKFKKEGWEVYLLTGTKTPTRRHPFVFEQYDFAYNSDSIKEILDSASPDLILFTGAYDSGFSQQCTRQESMTYMSGLVNLLMASEMLRVPLFVYVSSHEVYGESYSDPIEEDQPVSPVSTRGLLISQGEKFVLQYGETTQMNTLVLRLDHLYWIPHHRREISEPYARMCLSALKDAVVSGSENTIHSSLFLSDAIYMIYEIVQKKDRRHTIYHLTSGEGVDDLDIAKRISETAGETVTVKDDTFGPIRCNIMSGQRAKEEFDIEIRFSCREQTARIMEYMKENPSAFLLRSERKENWVERLYRRFEKLLLALVPFVENGVVFLFLFLLNNRTADSPYFRRLDVFLLYVVLFAVFYGKRQAILAAFLSSIGFVFRQSYYRIGIEVLVDYNIYIWIAQLFIVGMAVGHLRDSLRLITDDKNEQIEFLTGQLNDIYDINSSNLKVKNILQDHILTYEDSLGVLQNITQRLEQLDSGEALYAAIEVLSEVTGTKDVAIYKVANADYCRLLAATTDCAKKLGKSLRYSALEEMEQSLRTREVFVNRTMKPELPVMACGLYHANSLTYIAMIWNLPLEKMSLHQIDLLKIISNMIQNSIERTDVYLSALSEKRYVFDTAILNKEAFAQRIQTERELREHSYADSTLLCIESAGAADEMLQHPDRLQQLNEIISHNIREIDVVGIGEDDRFYVLLVNTGTQDAQIVIRRFEDHGVHCVIGSPKAGSAKCTAKPISGYEAKRRQAPPPSVRSEVKQPAAERRALDSLRARRLREKRRNSGAQRLLNTLAQLAGWGKRGQ